MSLKKILAELIINGGETVDEDEFQRRLKICNGCEYKGRVKVMGLEYDGCTVCGCPFETKLRMRTVKNVLLKKVLSVEEVTCPHPEGAKW